jgi:branched-chain amino acid aminotransferase
LRSAEALGLKSPLSAGEIEDLLREGITKFPKGTPLYLRPFMYSEEGWMEPFPESTKLIVSVVEYAMPDPTKPCSVSFSKWRRPSPETAPTNAKAVSLYAQAGRAALDARSRGFNEAIMLDPMGNVAEFSAANLWIAKDGAAHTPVPNGTFLNGITRQRTIQLLRKAGVEVYERTLTPKDILEADEIFSSGNYGKLMPITQVEDRPLQPGPIFRRARELYWEFAHGG